MQWTSGAQRFETVNVCIVDYREIVARDVNSKGDFSYRGEKVSRAGEVMEK